VNLFFEHNELAYSNYRFDGPRLFCVDSNNVPSFVVTPFIFNGAINVSWLRKVAFSPKFALTHHRHLLNEFMPYTVSIDERTSHKLWEVIVNNLLNPHYQTNHFLNPRLRFQI